jgi:hypothetical protein
MFWVMRICGTKKSPEGLSLGEDQFRGFTKLMVWGSHLRL